MKRCPTCEQEKPLDQFIKNRSTKSGFGSYCRPCAAERAKRQYRDDPQRALAVRRAWRTRNPERAKRLRRHYTLRREYGIGIEEYEQMLVAQEGKCGICESRPDKMLYVDHDHTTGAVRGLLCEKCNFGIGQFNDNPEALERAAQYIHKHHKTALRAVNEQ